MRPRVLAVASKRSLLLCRASYAGFAGLRVLVDAHASTRSSMSAGREGHLSLVYLRPIIVAGTRYSDAGAVGCRSGLARPAMFVR